MDRHQLFAQAVALSLGAPDVEAWPWESCDEDWVDPLYVDVPSLGSFCVLDLDADTWTNQVRFAVASISSNSDRRDHPSLRHQPSTVTVELTDDELTLVLDALDSHEYWQIAERGDRLPVKNGAVWLGDYDGRAETDPYWPDPPERLDEVTAEAIRDARELRSLEEKLRRSARRPALRQVSSPTATRGR